MRAAFGDASLAHVGLPHGIRRVLFRGDDDAPVRAAVTAAATAFRDRRSEVVEPLPKAGCKDFNQQWLPLHA